MCYFALGSALLNGRTREESEASARCNKVPIGEEGAIHPHGGATQHRAASWQLTGIRRGNAKRLRDQYLPRCADEIERTALRSSGIKNERRVAPSNSRWPSNGRMLGMQTGYQTTIPCEG